jgi:hypothetical protein
MGTTIKQERFLPGVEMMFKLCQYSTATGWLSWKIAPRGSQCLSARNILTSHPAGTCHFSAKDL